MISKIYQKYIQGDSLSDQEVTNGEKHFKELTRIRALPLKSLPKRPTVFTWVSEITVQHED